MEGLTELRILAVDDEPANLLLAFALLFFAPAVFDNFSSGWSWCASSGPTWCWWTCTCPTWTATRSWSS